MVIGVVLSTVGSVVGATWYLSSRLTSQDIWIRSLHRRVSRIEKKMGTGWDDDVSGS